MQGNFIYNESVRVAKEFIKDFIDYLLYLYEKADDDREASLLENLIDDYRNGNTSCIAEVKGILAKDVEEFCKKETIPCTVVNHLTPEMNYVIIREKDIEKVRNFLKEKEGRDVELSKIDDQMAIPVVKATMSLDNSETFESLEAVSDINATLNRLREEGIPNSYVGFKMDNPTGAFVIKIGNPEFDNNGKFIENKLEYGLWCEDGTAKKISEADLILLVQEHVRQGGRIAFSDASELNPEKAEERDNWNGNLIEEKEIETTTHKDIEEEKETPDEVKEEEPFTGVDEVPVFEDETPYENRELKGSSQTDYQEPYNEPVSPFTDDSYDLDGKFIDIDAVARSNGDDIENAYPDYQSSERTTKYEEAFMERASETTDGRSNYEQTFDRQINSEKDFAKERRNGDRNTGYDKSAREEYDRKYESAHSYADNMRSEGSSRNEDRSNRYERAFTQNDEKEYQLVPKDEKKAFNEGNTEVSRSHNRTREYEKAVYNQTPEKGFERDGDSPNAQITEARIGFDSTVNSSGGGFSQFVGKQIQSVGKATVIAPIKEMWRENNDGAKQLDSMKKVGKNTVGKAYDLLSDPPRLFSSKKRLRLSAEELNAINEVLQKNGIKGISFERGRDLTDAKEAIQQFMDVNGINKNLPTDIKRKRILNTLQRQGISRDRARNIANNMTEIMNQNRKFDPRKIGVVDTVADMSEEADDNGAMDDFNQAKQIVENTVVGVKLADSVTTYATDVMVRNAVVPVGRLAVKTGYYTGRIGVGGTRLVGRLAYKMHMFGMKHIAPYNRAVHTVGRMAHTTGMVVKGGVRLVGRAGLGIWNFGGVKAIRNGVITVGRAGYRLGSGIANGVKAVGRLAYMVGTRATGFLKAGGMVVAKAFQGAYMYMMRFRVFRFLRGAVISTSRATVAVGRAGSFVIQNEAKALKRLAKSAKALLKVCICIGCIAMAIYFVGYVLLIVGEIPNTVITGFFDNDEDANDVAVLESITGKSYVALLKADRDWILGLSKIGNGVSLSHLKYLEDGISLKEYYATGTITGCTGIQGNKLLGPEPFVGAPVDAYKKIADVDGGAELSYMDGEGNPTANTTNYKEILSMSGAFFDEDYQEIGKEDNKFTQVVDRIFSYANKISDVINKAKRHLLDAVVNFFAGTIFDDLEHVEVMTGRDILDSYISKTYCVTLHAASHQEITELELRILPKGTESVSNDTFFKALEFCPKSEMHGCMHYNNFFFTDDGAISTDGSTAIPRGSELIYSEDNCANLSDDAKATSPCWKKVVDSVSTISTEGEGGTNGANAETANVNDADSGTQSQKVETYHYEHECAGGHSGIYCGGHAIAKETAKIYSFTKDQRNAEFIHEYDKKYSGIHATVHEDTTYAKVKDNNKLDILSMYINEVDEEYIDKGKDIFDIDTGIKHFCTPIIWRGWNAFKMEQTMGYYGEDWQDLYNLNMANYGTSAGGYGGNSKFIYGKGQVLDNATIRETLRSIDEFQDLSDADIDAIINGTYTGDNQRACVVAYALNWVGRLGYAFGGGRTGVLENVSATDCSGFVSGVANHFGLMNGVLNTDGFKNLANSSWANAKAGDILIRWKAGGNGSFNHALLFVGHINGVPYTVDCSTVSGVGSVYLRSRGEAYYAITYVYDFIGK